MKVNDGHCNSEVSMDQWDRDLRSLGNLGFNLYAVRAGNVDGLPTLHIPPTSEWLYEPTERGHCHLCGNPKDKTGFYESFADGEYRNACPTCRDALNALGWQAYMS